MVRRDDSVRLGLRDPDPNLSGAEQEIGRSGYHKQWPCQTSENTQSPIFAITGNKANFQQDP